MQNWAFSVKKRAASSEACLLVTDNVESAEMLGIKPPKAVEWLKFLLG
jgi:hypothetical protein